VTAQDGYAVPDSPVVVTVDGELDAADSRWSRELDDAIGSGRRRIVVDLLNVTFADSSVVKSLVMAHRRTADDGWIRLVYTNHVIRRVIDICGLTELLPQFTTVDAALRGAPTRQHPDDGKQGRDRNAREVARRHAVPPAPSAPSEPEDGA
jgi:anti-anti-sigma factor